MAVVEGAGVIERGEEGKVLLGLLVSTAGCVPTHMHNLALGLGRPQ